MKTQILITIFIQSVVLAFGSTTDSLSYFEPSTSHKNTSHPLVHSFSFSAGVDYVANSVDDDVRGSIPKDDKIYVNSSIPLNLKYSFSFTNPNIRHYLPGGYQGVSLGVLNLGSLQSQGFSKASHNIGYPVLAYLFQGGPFFHLKDNITLDYEWNFGASFGWKPASDFNRYFNLTVGSRVNAYLALNLMVNWSVNSHTSLFAGLAVSHFSNGNTSFPNPGINSMGIRLGVVYTINPLEKPFPYSLPDTVKRRKVEYDILAWGAARKRVYRGGEQPLLLNGHFACAGLSFSPMVRLNTWWRVGGALDIQWDESSDLKKNYVSGSTSDDILFYRPSFWRQLTLGVSAHGELRMPIFAVNIGCGYNFVSPVENRGSYQNIALKTYLTSFLYINIGYQLRNFHQQSSLMLGLGTTI